MNFKIRVVENIGFSSVEMFGRPGTEFQVENGKLEDLEGIIWDKDDEPYECFEDIEKYFGDSDIFETKFELIKEEGCGKGRLNTLFSWVVRTLFSLKKN